MKAFIQKLVVLLLTLLLGFNTSLLANHILESPHYASPTIFQPISGKKAMIAGPESYALQAGLDVLKGGGNAIDSAITMAFVLGVTTPHEGNIGGGGFMLIYLADKKQVVAIDYREKAPKLANENLFLNEGEQLDMEKTRYSYLAAGVPGTVAGLTYVLEKYGTISLARAMQPAIDLAENGFEVSQSLNRALVLAKDRFSSSSEAMKIFYKKNGDPYKPGEILVQKDLAWSLRQIAENGAGAFYKGAIASRFVKAMHDNGGLMTDKDLLDYKVVVRKPVKGTFRGYDIYSMPPPSSGGVHIIQMLNLLEPFPMGIWGHNSAKTIHVMTEAMKLAYADRAAYLGDPDFEYVPTEGLISKKYANTVRIKMKLNKAIPSTEITPGKPIRFEGNETNHFSIVDEKGNAVANTYTLNFTFGSKIVVPGTGIILNNQMDDFVSQKGKANAYGLVGFMSNTIGPEKRMLSSMAPTIVMKNGKPFLVTGSPGGAQIITSVLQVILNVIEHKMNLADATNALRIHHQWIPDVLQVERTLNNDTREKLISLGHTLQDSDAMGGVHSVLIQDGVIYGAADPRKPDSKAGGY